MQAFAPIIAFGAMAALMVGMGLASMLANAFSDHPVKTVFGVAVALAFVASAVWVSRSRSREPAFLVFWGLLLATGWFATYDTDFGRRTLGVDIAPMVYERTRFAYGSFADRLEWGAVKEVAYAERCDAAIMGGGGDGAACRRVFPEGVDRGGLDRLRRAIANRDWQEVENARRSLGDIGRFRYELY